MKIFKHWPPMSIQQKYLPRISFCLALLLMGALSAKAPFFFAESVDIGGESWLLIDEDDGNSLEGQKKMRASSSRQRDRHLSKPLACTSCSGQDDDLDEEDDEMPPPKPKKRSKPRPVVEEDDDEDDQDEDDADDDSSEDEKPQEEEEDDGDDEDDDED